MIQISESNFDKLKQIKDELKDCAGDLLFQDSESSTGKSISDQIKALDSVIKNPQGQSE